MTEFWSLVIPGLVTGAIYSMMASGLVLTYQTSGVFNFAHAAAAFATAYVYYQLNTGIGLPIWLAAAIAVLIFAPLLGLALDRVVLRRLRTAPIHARIVATIGLLVAIPNMLQWIVELVLVQALGLGGLVDVGTASANGQLQPRGVGPDPAKVVHLGFIGLDEVALTSDQLAVFAAAGLTALGLFWLLRWTRLGLEMRALVDREALASLRGIHPDRTSAIAWTLTMILAGLGGILIAPLFQLDNATFQFVVLGSLAAVAVAGFRSLPWAFAGGLILGVIQNLVAGYREDLLPSFLEGVTGISTSVPFVLLLLVLLASLGGAGRSAASVAEEKPMADHRAGLPAWRKRLPWGLGVGVLILFTMGWIPGFSADQFAINTYIAPGLAYAIIFLSFVVVTGVGGMISLAQPAFVTLGGMATGYLLQKDLGWGVPLIGSSEGHPSFLAACLLGSGIAAILGALIAAAVRRLGPLALALGTLALGFCLDFIFFRLQGVSNGGLGWDIPGPSFSVFGGEIAFDVFEDHGKNLVLLLLALFGVITLLIRNLERSASGRAIFAARSSDVAARTSGITVWKSQVALFALSAGIAGLGGVWLSLTTFTATPTLAPPQIGLFWLTIIVLMGVRRPGGALLGGMFMTSSVYIFGKLGDVIGSTGNDLVTSPYFMQMLAGLGAVQLAANPDGILALMGHNRLERRRKKQRRAHIADAQHEIGVAEPPTHVISFETAERLAAATSPIAEPPTLVIDNVVAGYGDVEVLHGLSLAVGRGEIVALLGPNGAGKSTLCQVAAGALASTSGRVVLNGVDITALTPSERARSGMILVPEARGIFPGLRVEDNLQILLRDRADRDAVYDRYPILAERRNQPAGVLSGGEQQLLSLAPVIQNPPALLIADEPTLGLSPQVAEAILAALVEIRSAGTSVLLVEERASEIMKIADLVGIVDLGRLTWMGPTSETKGELLAAAYLS